MKAKIFQPFQKVWTPRTPDSNYDSLGSLPPPPIVNAKLITESLSSAIGLGTSIYEPQRVSGGGAEASGYGISLQSAVYTPAP
jgi:hypothetical protein